MNVPARRLQASLEDNPEYFWEQFMGFAARFSVGPEPFGSPLLEVITPFGPLFTFDRGVVPLSSGNLELVLHGQVENWSRNEPDNRIASLGNGRYEAIGQVQELVGRNFFVLVLREEDNQLRLVLSSESLPEAHDWIRVQLAPPLMSFRA